MSTQYRRVLQFTKVLLTGLCLNGAFAGLAAAADVAYVTNENGGVSVVDIVTAKIVKEFDIGGKTPRGIGVTKDGRYVLTANKNSGDMSVIDAQTGTVVRRVPLGPGPEFLRVYGNTALVTYEPDGMKEEDGDEDDDKDDDKYEKPIPAYIAIVDIPSGKILLSFQSGVETEGIELSPDGKLIVTTNEGDEAISVHNASDGKVVRTIDTKPYGKRPRGLAALPGGKGYVVTFENSSSLAVLDADFNVVQKVATRMGPNGVAFDPTGKLMLIAAARAGLLQIFDATTYALVKEVPIGRRCWHFTYTPDGSKILVACGRTDDLQVIDAKTFTPITSIAGFKLPWGVVTYPKAHGSLDIP